MCVLRRSAYVSSEPGVDTTVWRIHAKEAVLVLTDSKR